MNSWIVSQIGAREHYAIPRALYQQGGLHTLITDAWVTPNSWVQHCSGKSLQALSDRYHPDLSPVAVCSYTNTLLSFELKQRLFHDSSWSTIIARNNWFQRKALQSLKHIDRQLLSNQQPILFSYSYAALQLFRYARQRGWRTVLCQIDPGLIEEKQVAQHQERYKQQYTSSWTPAPNSYWQDWQQECYLADSILVNSDWSQKALTATGISEDKISIVPLAYKVPVKARTFVREYPSAFTPKRPLRVLFLGQIILRKGIAEIIESVAKLTHEPIEIWLVGSTEIDLATSLGNYSQLKWLGSVPRGQVYSYYQKADVFLFPTHSDGFGLTQLEAQAWKLPIIASSYCGKVVTHQRNGLVLPEVTGNAIADSLRICRRYPKRLREWSEQSINLQDYSLTQLAKILESLAYALV